MNWNKKVDGVKLSELFESGRGRRKLDFNRKDKEYIEAVKKRISLSTHTRTSAKHTKGRRPRLELKSN